MRFDTTTILVASILLAVAGALAFAALYAVYGRPTTTAGKERKQHVVNGFRLAGGLLLGIVLVGTFVTAIGVGFLGIKLESAPLSFSV